MKVVKQMHDVPKRPEILPARHCTHIRAANEPRARDMCASRRSEIGCGQESFEESALSALNCGNSHPFLCTYYPTLRVTTIFYSDGNPRSDVYLKVESSCSFKHFHPTLLWTYPFLRSNTMNVSSDPRCSLFKTGVSEDQYDSLTNDSLYRL